MSHNSHLSDPLKAKRGVSQIADICNYSLNAKQRTTAEIAEKGDLEDHSEAQIRRNSVDFYLAQSKARNTRKAYRSDLEQFEAWGGAIPTSPEQLASYLAEHAVTLAVSTLKRRVAAIAWAHREQRLEDPTKSSLVKQVVKGIGRHHGEKQKQVSPLLLEQLERIVVGLGHAPKDWRDKALLLVGFYGAFRGSELLSLCVENCIFDEGGALLHLHKSKTDQAARGRWVAIPRFSGRSCPTEALERWIAECGYDAGPLFRPLSGAPSNRRSPLSVRSLSRVIQNRVASIGMSSAGFSSHSLRAGFVTSALGDEIDPITIARQTGHKSIEVLAKYNRPSTTRFSPSFEGLRKLLASTRLDKEVCDVCGEGSSKAFKDGNSGVFKASLQPADVSPVNFRIYCQSLLGNAPGDPEFSEIVSNDTLSLHAVKSSSCR